MKKKKKRLGQISWILHLHFLHNQHQIGYHFKSKLTPQFYDSAYIKQLKGKRLSGTNKSQTLHTIKIKK